MVKLSPQQAANKAREIAKQSLSGALATVRRGQGKGQGTPYVSKVNVTVDQDGSPLFLLSTLATHTQDLLADSRASLLLEAPENSENPLQTERTTLVGMVSQIEPGQDRREREVFLAHHPEAQQYAVFGDFALWRMTVCKIHYVGGFGLSKWAKAKDYLTETEQC